MGVTLDFFKHFVRDPIGLETHIEVWLWVNISSAVLTDADSVNLYPLITGKACKVRTVLTVAAYLVSLEFLQICAPYHV